LNFTLRDGIGSGDFINVACLGNKDYIAELEDKIQISKSSGKDLFIKKIK
jgi:hypothetical protein